MIKHFIDLDNFTKTELRNILSFAAKIKKNQKKYSNILSNKSLGLLFEKESTRTRTSFNIGMQKLGGNVIELDSKKIGFGKRESISDVIQTLSQYIDVLMIRNNSHEELVQCANYNKISIINGLSNYSHPCQVLSDIFTITEKLGKIENKQYDAAQVLFPTRPNTPMLSERFGRRLVSLVFLCSLIHNRDIR